MEISVATRIRRAVPLVWRWYAVDHVANHPRWDPEMALTPISRGPMGVGTRIHRRNTRWGTPVEGEMEITAWEPERVLAAHIRDANMEIDGRVTFEPASANETLLTITTVIPGLDESRGEVLRGRMERTASNIKALIEGET